MLGRQASSLQSRLTGEIGYAGTPSLQPTVPSYWRDRVCWDAKSPTFSPVLLGRQSRLTGEIGYAGTPSLQPTVPSYWGDRYTGTPSLQPSVPSYLGDSPVLLGRQSRLTGEIGYAGTPSLQPTVPSYWGDRYTGTPSLQPSVPSYLGDSPVLLVRLGMLGRHAFNL